MIRWRDRAITGSDVRAMPAAEQGGGNVRTTKAAATAVGLAVLAMVAAGCDSGDSATPTKTTPPTVAHLPSSTSTSAAEALTTYRNAWAAAVKAKITSDYQSPELPKYASYEGLAYFVGTTLDNFKKGLVVKGEPGLMPRVTRETEDQVTILDCLDDSRWLKYRMADGQLEDNVPGGHRRTEAVVTRHPIGWRVSKITVEEVGTC